VNSGPAIREKAVAAHSGAAAHSRLLIDRFHGHPEWSEGSQVKVGKEVKT